LARLLDKETKQLLAVLAILSIAKIALPAMSTGLATSPVSMVPVASSTVVSTVSPATSRTSAIISLPLTLQKDSSEGSWLLSFLLIFTFSTFLLSSRRPISPLFVTVFCLVSCIFITCVRIFHRAQGGPCHGEKSAAKCLKL